MKELQWSLAIGTKNLTATAELQIGLVRFTIFKKGKQYCVSEYDIDADSLIYYDYLFDSESEAIASVEKEYIMRCEETMCKTHYTGNDYGVDAYTGQKEWWDT